MHRLQFLNITHKLLQGCSVREKGTVWQRFCVIYKILGHYFLFLCYIKKRLHQGQLLEIFCKWNYSHKNVCNEFLFWQQPAIFLLIDLSKDVVLQVIAKNICSKHIVMVFNFSKKDSIIRLALSRDLKNGVCLRRFAEGALYFW